MRDWIIRRLPPHNAFVEAFGGSFAVGCKMPTPTKNGYRLVYNDLDRHVWNFFRCVRDHPQELTRALELTPYSRAEFDDAVAFIKSPDKPWLKAEPVEWARRYVIYNRQSMFGKEDGTWCVARKGENVALTWSDLPSMIPPMAAHLKEAFIECLDYRRLLKKWDAPETLFYLDPPYEGVEKSFYGVNKKTGFDHEKMREHVGKLKGSWAVSYYDSPYIRDLYSGYRFYELDVKKHMQTGGNKDTAVEVLIVHCNDWAQARSDAFVDCFDDQESD